MILRCGFRAAAGREWSEVVVSVKNDLQGSSATTTARSERCSAQVEVMNPNIHTGKNLTISSPHLKILIEIVQLVFPFIVKQIANLGLTQCHTYTVLAGADDSNLVCRIALSLLSPCKDFLVNVDEETIPETCCVGCLVLEKIVRNLKNRRKLKIGLCKCLQRDGSLSGADEDKAFQNGSPSPEQKNSRRETSGTSMVKRKKSSHEREEKLQECREKERGDINLNCIPSNRLCVSEWKVETPQKQKVEHTGGVREEVSHFSSYLDRYTAK
nr:non-specific lipid-transfer protein-like [Ipomoea batatas]